LEVFLSGSDPDARDKEKRGEKNCRKYATEMKNEKSPFRIRHRGGENVASLSDAEDEGRGEERRERHFQSAKIGGYKRGNAE